MRTPKTKTTPVPKPAASEPRSKEAGTPQHLSRRGFLGDLGGAAAATAALAAGGLSLDRAEASAAVADEIGLAGPQARRLHAYQLRHRAALDQRMRPLPEHPTNDDEARYADLRAVHGKGLPHDELGHPQRDAYRTLVGALASGRPTAFEAVPLGGTARLVNPLGAYAFEMIGADSHHLGLPAAPAFASAWEAGEAVEVYWQALTRDVPFSDYETDGLIDAAASELSGLSDFRGPKLGGQVTAGTVFRGGTPGDLVGPYLSQFLWLPVPWGPARLEQRYVMAEGADDFMTSYADWLAVQRGQAPARPLTLVGPPRFIRQARDLARYVHADFSYQAFLNAALILLSRGGPAADPGNPYVGSRTQAAFCSFGGPHVLDLVARAANCALKAAWYQKWLVHRRLRPEAFGGRIHNQMTGQANYGIHRDVTESGAVERVRQTHGTFLLPMAYPEGCPNHPAYPAGHAAIAGACVTVLKAFFNEDFVTPEPVQSSRDGDSLVPYVGPELTTGGELNKLASNISFGRDTAGVHWRSDGSEGMLLGEAVALSILRDYRETMAERFQGFRLTKFDGTSILVR